MGDGVGVGGGTGTLGSVAGCCCLGAISGGRAGGEGGGDVGTLGSGGAVGSGGVGAAGMGGLVGGVGCWMGGKPGGAVTVLGVWRLVKMVASWVRAACWLSLIGDRGEAGDGWRRA